MVIAAKVKRQMAEGGWIRKMFEEGIALKRKYGEDKVFDLSLGNPIMEPPAQFHEELRRLLANPIPGMHRYMPNPGYPEVRAAIATHLKKETGLPFTGNDVVMTAGAAGAVNVVIKAIAEPGDEIIIFAPYFAEYIYYIDNHDAVAKIVPTDARFQPDLNALEKAMNPKTRAILMNSPNNPSGQVYGAAIMTQIGEMIRRKEAEYHREIFLITDDPYRKIVFDDLEVPYIFGFHPRSIMATSHSKDLALPGERIGYAAVNPGYPDRAELVNGIIFCSRVLGYVNAPALMQHVVKNLQDVTVDVGKYQRQRDFLYDALTAMGYQILKPQGTFYIFPKTPIPDEMTFLAELLKYNVLVVPGSGFGTPGYFRIAYCTEDKFIEGSLPGFRAAARKFGLPG
jgi:aspartate aminotransferase